MTASLPVFINDIPSCLVLLSSEGQSTCLVISSDKNQSLIRMLEIEFVGYSDCLVQKFDTFYDTHCVVAV